MSIEELALTIVGEWDKEYDGQVPLAAKLALRDRISLAINDAVLEEREMCAQTIDAYGDHRYSEAIRGRSNT